MLDQSKLNRQNQAVQTWKINKGIGLLNFCTRFGKTNVGVIAIKEIRVKSQEIITILVPSEYIKLNWIQHTIDIPNIKVITVNQATINSNIIENGHTIIVDECHKFLSEERYNVLKYACSKHKFKMLLTGTPPAEERMHMLLGIAPIIDTITEEEAIANNWVSPFIEYNLSVNFNEEDKEAYFKYSTLIANTLETFRGVHKKVAFERVQLFKSDFDLIYACHQGVKLPKGFVDGNTVRNIVAECMGWNRNLNTSSNYGKNRDDNWNPSVIYDKCKAFKSFVKSRNDLIINNDTKLKSILEIIKANPVPTIIFNESIDFVNTIANALGENSIAYHSKIESKPIWDEVSNDWFRYKGGEKAGEVKLFGSSKIKEETIMGMINNKYKYLVTAKALDEGLTIPNIEQVIITSGSTNPIQHQQRSARGKTIDFNNPNKVCRIFNIYFDDIVTINGIVKSRDKVKLLERQLNSQNEVLHIQSINQISLL